MVDDTLLSYNGKRLRNLREILDKPLVVTRQTQELTDFSWSLRCRPILDRVNLGWIDVNSILIDYVAKEMDFTKPKVTFRKLSIKLFCSKEFQNESQMTLVFLLTLGIDQDVVDENNNKLIQVWFTHSVHEIHENRRCVCQPERHNQKLVVSVMSPECCLRDVLISDSQLMIARSQINLRVEARSLQRVEQVIDTRKGITILNSHLVEFTIVYAHSKCTVLLNK
ncbi:hypothetical protein HanPI659440_Chr11g0423371 [Helianthus annuus]|nr:hypothetical protein HanPI659440_Chr11g0423371 [Helianthus annuus]